MKHEVILGFDAHTPMGDIVQSKRSKSPYAKELRSEKGVVMTARCKCLQSRKQPGACAAHFAQTELRLLAASGLLKKIDSLVAEIEAISGRTDFSENPDLVAALRQLFELRKSAETK